MLEEPGAGISPGLRCLQLGKGGRVTQGRAQRKASKPAGLAEQSWPAWLPQVLVDDALGVFPNPGGEKMCRDTREYQLGAFRERDGHS